MARKRRELTPEHEAHLRALMTRGSTVEDATKALNAAGAGTSQATVGRRMREMRGEVNAERASRMTPASTPTHEGARTRPFPTTPEDIPEDATPDDLNWYEAESQRLADAAAEAGDLKAWGNLARVGMTARDQRRKEAPPVKEDPNDRPDMVKLGAEVEARFFKMIDLVVEGA